MKKWKLFRPPRPLMELFPHFPVFSDRFPFRPFSILRLRRVSQPAGSASQNDYSDIWLEGGLGEEGGGEEGEVVQEGFGHFKQAQARRLLLRSLGPRS